MYKYYLLYNKLSLDEKTGEGELGHLLAYNTGERDCTVDVAVFYETGEKDHLSLFTRAGKTEESNYESWKIIKPGKRFACVVQSMEPLVCQVTVSNNNTLNNYCFVEGLRPDYRETVMAYTAISSLAYRWYHADGVVINSPGSVWVRESEWLILLNTENQVVKADVQLDYNSGKQSFSVELEPMSVKYVFMDEIAEQNKSYGACVTSGKPVAAQWLRTVRWYDRPELMSYWSLPMVPAAQKGKADFRREAG